MTLDVSRGATVMIKLVLGFVVAIGAAIATAACLLASDNSTLRDLGKELGKLTGQVVLVTVIGGVILQEYNRRRDQKSERRERRNRMIGILVESYSSAKRSRRLLRAKCRATPPAVGAADGLHLSRVTYEEQMGSLNDVQLSLEMLIHDFMTFPETFKRQDEIKRAVERMENYLGTLITEYENGHRLVDDSQPVHVAGVHRFADFLHGKKDSFFRKNFTYSFRIALALMRGGDIPLSQLPVQASAPTPSGHAV
ncbi:MAG: hypothetical protein ACT4P7_21075 [Gemmatimonadaceae bacterium]